jgi:hypothetical protein
MLRKEKYDTMTESHKPPTWYWVVAGIALAWNLLGVMAFAMDMMMDEQGLALLTEEQREIYINTPVWAMTAYGIAVFGGALGSIGLLMRKNFADIFFRASLAGLVIQNINSYFLANSWEVFGPWAAVMALFLIAVAVYLIILAGRAKTNGWTT